MKQTYWILIIALGVTLGLAGGLGGFTFYYANGASYLSNDPKACINCHLMREQYSGWEKSPHHSFATCNDCHAPHSLIPKYFVKAKNGFWHSWAFTTQRFPENIQISQSNRKVTEQACLHCHANFVHTITKTGTVSCVKCHRSVGHLH